MSADIAGEHRSRRLGAGKRNRHVGRAADDLRGAVGMRCSLVADQCFQNDQELLGEHGDVRSQMVRSSNPAWFVCQAIFAGSTKWFRDLAHSFTSPASRNHNSKKIPPFSDARTWRTVAMRASKLSSISMSNSQGLAFSRRRGARALRELRPSKSERAQGRPGTGWHPWSACNKKARGRTTGSAENTRPSLRGWFYGLLRALPGDRAFLPPSPARRVTRLCELSASVGAPGPHGLAVREAIVRPHSR
jgi:hypothetical protein